MFWRGRKAREEDLERELNSHLELEAAEQQDEGLSPGDARYAARRALGNAARVKEDVRLAWGWSRWGILVQDLRRGARTLRKSPGFAATAILTLAIGIGASTAIFSILDAVVLRPLAYPDSGRLVVAWERVRFLGADATGPNPRHVHIWQKRATAFSGLTVVRIGSAGISLGTDHPRLVGSVASLPNLFDVLQASPVLGRGFLPEDGVEGHDNIAVLSFSLWQSLFHGDPGAIGKTIRIRDTPHQIVGIMPASFQFPNGNALRSFRSKQPVSGAPEPAVFLPLALNLSEMEWNGNYGNFIALGRLKHGVTIPEAETQLNAIQAQVQQEMPGRSRDDRPGALGASLQPMQEAIAGDTRTGLWLLMAAVCGLMLIACLNLANAQLGRGLARRRDAAIRAALGAARWRLIWSAMAESLLISAVGGTAGVLLAAAGLSLFRRHCPIDLPRLAEVHLSPNVLAFSGALALAATLLSAMLPAVRLRSADPQLALQQNTHRALGASSSHRLRTSLIALQVFGCTVLLLVTGLFAKSLVHLLSQDKGFESDNVAIAEVRLTTKTYATAENRIAFNDAVLGNLRGIPGVEAAGLVSAMPLEGEAWIEFLQRVDRPQQQGPLVNARWVSPGYFEATRQRIVSGRFFEEGDRSLNSIVLSEGEAKALWGDESPIGSQASILGRTFTVIGVVADSRSTSLKSASARMAYVYYNYRPPYTMFFVARSTQRAEAVMSSMRQAIWKQAPDVTIARIKTLDSQVSDSLARERFQTLVLMAFGISALLLAMLGIYGVLTYSVAARKQEIGVRMALGATRHRIYAITFAEAGVPVITGLISGLIASAAAGRVVRTLLYGVQAVDAPVALVVTGLFLVSASAAAFVPARRAASVDPMVALRAD